LNTSAEARSIKASLTRAVKEGDWWSKIGIEPLGFAHEQWLATIPGISALQENSKAGRP